MVNDLPRVVVIFGPTASGKTARALVMAERLGGEVINADSRQVYKHMPILTACPGAEEYARAPHHLFEFMDPREKTDAARWAKLAGAAIEDILARGKVPIVVGGTGFYLRTLMEGMSEIPDIPDEVVCEFEGIDAPVLHAQLHEVDPKTADRLKPGDTQRIVRALCVWRHTGIALSDWQGGEKKGFPYTFEKLAVNLPREMLYARIGKRWEAMVAAGVVDEAEALRDAGYTLDMPGMSCLGMAELFAYLDGKIALDAVGEVVVRGTRQYAKRQVTWLRHSYGADRVLE